MAFLRDKLEEPAIHKVRWNEPLTTADLEALEQMLVQAGVGTAEEIEKVAQQEHGLGLFVRSLVGLDRAAAKRAFSKFLEDRQLNAQQLDFVNLIVDHLTQCGWMRPEQLYSSPFTDEFTAGPNTIFTEEAAMQALISTLSAIRLNAAGLDIIAMTLKAVQESTGELLLNPLVEDGCAEAPDLADLQGANVPSPCHPLERLRMDFQDRCCLTRV
jgi:type I restriction enzyme R subunit